MSAYVPWEIDTLVRAVDKYVDQRLNTQLHELAESIRRAWADHDPKKPGNVCMLSALNAADYILHRSQGDRMSQVPPALLSLLEGKNAELKQHHLAVRVGDLQGSRVQAVRDVLDGWAPEEGTSIHALWTQVGQAIELYTEEIERIREESFRAIPGVTDPEYRSGDDG